MHKYKPYRTIKHNKGFQRIYRFANGYGASIIQHSFSYGLELAVIEFPDRNSNKYTGPVYYTPITDDVIGYLTVSEISNLLDNIAAL